jgi:FkbM family methyltransferase
MRRLIIPPVRGYMRYAGWPWGKWAVWRAMTVHYYGLEPPDAEFTGRTIFSSRVCSNAQDVIGRYIYYFGVWEPNQTAWIRRRLAPGDGFIDIGANIGYYSLLASRLVGESGRVVAVEALPALFSALHKNLQLNGAKNVRSVNCAAWDRDEILTLYTRPGDLPGQTTVIPSWADRYQLRTELRVPAAPLSTILKPEEFKTARLVKIDVEGAEWHVLAGMKSLIPSGRDDLEIIIEVNPSALQLEGKTPEDVFDFFAPYGFHAYQVENDYLAERYIRREAPRAPKRLESAPKEQADVIFSRLDAGSL